MAGWLAGWPSLAMLVPYTLHIPPSTLHPPPLSSNIPAAPNCRVAKRLRAAQPRPLQMGQISQAGQRRAPRYVGRQAVNRSSVILQLVFSRSVGQSVNLQSVSQSVSPSINQPLRQ